MSPVRYGARYGALRVLGRGPAADPAPAVARGDRPPAGGPAVTVDTEIAHRFPGVDRGTVHTPNTAGGDGAGVRRATFGDRRYTLPETIFRRPPPERADTTPG